MVVCNLGTWVMCIARDMAQARYRAMHDEERVYDGHHWCGTVQQAQREGWWQKGGGDGLMVCGLCDVHSCRCLVSNSACEHSCCHGGVGVNAMHACMDVDLNGCTTTPNAQQQFRGVVVYALYSILQFCVQICQLWKVQQSHK